MRSKFRNPRTISQNLDYISKPLITPGFLSKSEHITLSELGERSIYILRFKRTKKTMNRERPELAL